MEVKSYYATSVESAMEQARRELGEDALLIRINPPKAESKARYEVVFAAEPRVAGDPAPGSTQGFVTPALRIDDLACVRPLDLVPSGDTFASLLALAGVNETESRAFFCEPQMEIPAAESNPPHHRREFVCCPGLGRAGLSEAVVALVGAAGCGKTTMIMKLALLHGVMVSRPTRILAFDPERIGSGSRLKRFAQVVEISFQEFETLDDLSSALRHRSPGLTLIDTAGYGRADSREISLLADCLLACSEVEVQLLLRVDQKTADNLDVIRRFLPLQPARMILTCLDESLDLSDLAGLVEQTQIPLSFFGVGQRVPEDLEPASDSWLSRLISPRTSALALSAA